MSESLTAPTAERGPRIPTAALPARGGREATMEISQPQRGWYQSRKCCLSRRDGRKSPSFHRPFWTEFHRAVYQGLCPWLISAVPPAREDPDQITIKTKNEIENHTKILCPKPSPPPHVHLAFPSRLRRRAAVAKRHWKLASHNVAGVMRPKPIRVPEGRRKAQSFPRPFRTDFRSAANRGLRPRLISCVPLARLFR